MSHSTRHIQFKAYIDKLMECGTIQYATVVSLCEEKIEKYEDCICYYMIYLHALTTYDTGNLFMESKVKSVILRGLTLARQGCDGMMTRFLEHIFMVASSHGGIAEFKGKLLCCCNVIVNLL